MGRSSTIYKKEWSTNWTVLSFVDKNVGIVFAVSKGSYFIFFILVIIFLGGFMHTSRLTAAEKDLNSKLFYAVEQNNLDEVKELIKNGADIHAREISGKKAIHIAVKKGNKNIVEFFLNEGIRVNDTSNSGWTPLHYAAFSGELEVAKLLVAKGANVRAENAYGQKPIDLIHYSKDDGYKGVMELLLDKGKGKVNDTDKDGCTLLRYAVIIGNLEAIKFLIDKGANIHAKDNEGRTPLDLAREGGNTEVVNMLSSINTKMIEVSVSQLPTSRGFYK